MGRQSFPSQGLKPSCLLHGDGIRRGDRRGSNRRIWFISAQLSEGSLDGITNGGVAL